MSWDSRMTYRILMEVAYKLMHWMQNMENDFDEIGTTFFSCWSISDLASICARTTALLYDFLGVLLNMRTMGTGKARILAMRALYYCVFRLFM